MPSIKDKSTVDAIAREFCSNDRSKAKALMAVGYSRFYSERQGKKLFNNVQLNEAIAKIDKETSEILDWNRITNLKACKEQLKALAPMIARGNIQAIQAATAVIRELNASNGQHSSIITNRDEPKPESRTTEEEAVLADTAAFYKNRMANVGRTKKEA